MSERIHGLKKDSEAYQLVLQALDIALSASKSEANQFLRETVCDLGLVYWECLAVAQCFEKSLEELT